MKLVWLTDIHMMLDGEMLLGHSPEHHLQLAIDDINTHHHDAMFCVITGDLAENPNTETYEYLRTVLERLNVPYLLMIGNQDDRDIVLEKFTFPASRLDGFVQYSVETPEGLIVCLDTHKPGEGYGELCGLRLDWLRETLEKAGEIPSYVFMHHPPDHLGLPMFDDDVLESGDEFLWLLGNYACTRHLFFRACSSAY